MLPRKEVIRRLRERGQPVKLFAESDEETYLRLKQLEISEPDLSNGVGNDYKAAMDKVNDEINDAYGAMDGSSSKNTDVIAADLNTNIEEIQALVQELSPTNNSNDERIVAKDCEIMSKFLRFILESWGKRLNSRPMEEKTSQEGKNISARYTSTRANLKPLFRLLKRNNISSDILRQLKLIAKDLVSRSYREANSHYIEMSVGNAAWPMGVTMVGIHARTGREKISQNNIAHALNDETQRKYIQGIKRLITQFSEMFPTDPSRSF